MIVSLSNHQLTASFATKGAELQSLVSKETNINYIWCGDANYWGKFSPVLFPIVGALKNNTYIFNEKPYQLPRHGFARDMDFGFEKIAENEIVFTLAHSDETLKVFPFEFILSLRYKLIANTLSCTYEVKNLATNDLYFSIGGHPAFAVPLNSNEAFDDYFLQFNKDESLTAHHVLNNLISNNTKVIALNQRKLALTHQLFAKDALVLKTLKSDTISLLNQKNKHGLDFKFKDFPYFGIWAAKNADFVCLEPWCGIADGENHHQEFTQKEGINCLLPNGTWQRTWSVTCF